MMTACRTVLLIGRSEAALRMLETLLRGRGIAVCIARNLREVTDATGRAHARLAVYDHSRDEPFDLDPRDHGFEGRLLVLSDESSYRLRQMNLHSEVIRKPVAVSVILDRIVSLLA